MKGQVDFERKDRGRTRDKGIAGGFQRTVAIVMK